MGRERMRLADSEHPVNSWQQQRREIYVANNLIPLNYQYTASRDQYTPSFSLLLTPSVLL